MATEGRDRAAGLRRVGAAGRRFARWLVRGPARAAGSKPPWYRRLGSLVGRVLAGLFLAAVLSVAVLRWVPPLTTAFIVRERIFGETPVSHEWTPWREISPQVGLAVVASEDQLFPEHHGFDLVQIREALADGGGRGASTISQQVAKNLFLWPGGGYFRKGIEAGLTVLIETLWPKRRILEVYLNIAEFGPGVFGVGEASRRYFGKEPAQLTTAEAARLAAVLPSPKRMSARNPGDYVRRRTGEIVRQMGLLGGPSYLAGIVE